MAKQLGMAINLDRCIGCHACTIACKTENGLPVGVSWHRVATIGAPGAGVGVDLPSGTYPNLTMSWLPVPCQHCENPPCMAVCPAAAITKRADGIVLVDQSKCVGCTYCSWVCPYKVPQFGTDGLMQKCTFCAQRVDQGEVPACVAACVYGARTFGEVSDPNSEVSQLIAQKHGTVLLADQRTNPAVYYLGHERR